MTLEQKIAEMRKLLPTTLPESVVRHWAEREFAMDRKQEMQKAAQQLRAIEIAKLNGLLL